FWTGRYPTLPEFGPLWREFEELGIVLAMHTFPSREALTPEWGRRMDEARGANNPAEGQGLLFTDEAVVYSPGQFVSNITFAMDPTIDSSEALGFMMEAMVWVTTVLMTGWLDNSEAEGGGIGVERLLAAARARQVEELPRPVCLSARP